MPAKKDMKTQETVRIDTTQLVYLKYVSELTAVPVAALVREALEDWLDTCYAGCVQDIEKKRGLAATTAATEEPKDLHKAFDNMIRNLKLVQEENERRKALAARV